MKRLKCICVVVLMAFLAACSSVRLGPTYALPVAVPPNPNLTTLLPKYAYGGAFHAAMTSRGACAWLGSRPNKPAIYWPAGYRVRLNPVELLNPKGQVVATEGQLVGVDYGLGGVAGPGDRCATAGQGIIPVQGKPFTAR
jgi:hypothetical protein